MIYGKIPEYEEIIEYLRKLEEEVHGLESVSYTHLDVYKRQHRYHEPRHLCERDGEWQLKIIDGIEYLFHRPDTGIASYRCV